MGVEVLRQRQVARWAEEEETQVGCFVRDPETAGRLVEIAAVVVVVEVVVEVAVEVVAVPAGRSNPLEDCFRLS